MLSDLFVFCIVVSVTVSFHGIESLLLRSRSRVIHKYFDIRYSPFLTCSIPLLVIV